ncbi:MAG: MerR family transcriptional regulator [Gammaproteobacteria bacterium]|nr:MerR family transcriptional regulator [Gammaproteobacteria bacterium]
MTEQSPNPEAVADSIKQDKFPIRTVSSLTGVNSVTLRAWERRYGLIQPQRTPKGHRLYTREDIDLINRILGLLDKGVSIGQVKEALERQQASSGGSEARDAWALYRDRMVAAIIRFDEAGLEDTYNEALSLYPVTQVTEKLVVPLLKELGRRWETAEGSIAEEHFFAVYLRNKLGARFHHRTRNSKGPKLLSACFPGENHELGMLLFALSAVSHDYRMVLLGADLPLDELMMAVKRSEAECIVLSGAAASSAEVIEKDLAELVASVDVPVVVGGLISVKKRDAIIKAGAVPLGEDIDSGIRKLSELLDHQI